MLFIIVPWTVELAVATDHTPWSVKYLNNACNWIQADRRDLERGKGHICQCKTNTEMRVQIAISKGQDIVMVKTQVNIFLSSNMPDMYSSKRIQNRYVLFLRNLKSNKCSQLYYWVWCCYNKRSRKYRMLYELFRRDINNLRILIIFTKYFSV